MVQGFDSDDENFLHMVRKDDAISNGGGSVAADYVSLIKQYESFGFDSSKIENIPSTLVKSNFFKKIPPLNLKLENWQSLAIELENFLSEQSSKQCMTQMNQNSGYNPELINPKRADFVYQQTNEKKKKASNFSALVLKIGSWERVTRHEGDLVAKCYYAKKKLVWEFLEMSLKRKIEIQWADIVGIKATIKENELGILQLELKQPPTFYHEIDPQPKKHTNWRLTQDFTQGQALSCRIHSLKFPPRILDRHFKKLLQCDNRLYELSLKPFPTLESSYFYPSSVYGTTKFSLNFIEQSPQIYHGLHFPHSQMNPYLFSAQQAQSYQPTMQMQMQPSFSFKDSSSPDSVDNSGMRFWGQATNNFPANHVQGHLINASTTPPPIVSYQNNNYFETGSVDGDLYYQMLLDLMNDSHIDKKCIASYEANYGQDISAGTDMEFSANEHSNDIARPVAWMLPQPTQEMPMREHSNNFVDQMWDDFASSNHNKLSPI